MHEQIKGIADGQFFIDQAFFEKEFADTPADAAENDQTSVNLVTTSSSASKPTPATVVENSQPANEVAQDDTEYRSFDGSNNNLANPRWGSVGIQLLRVTDAAYEDGISSLAVRGCSERTNPRYISNLLCRQKDVKENRNHLSDFVWAWGQFLDHEIDLTETVDEDASFNAPENDPLAPGATISFKRSQFDTATGTDNARQQINILSAYIDASNVYGNSKERADALRLSDGTGRMKVTTSPFGYGDLLPFNEDGLENAQSANNRALFIAGDIRANEHAVLTSLHTLFVREHNRLCLEILAHDPTLHGKDETIYQQARKIIGGQMQAITYQEFLPALLGADALSQYNGYKSDVNAGINNVFSTAAYRLGHSMLSSRLKLGDGFRTILLRQAFFNPNWVIYNDIEPFLQARARQVMQEIDTRIIEDVRSFLFGPPGDGKLLDLAALNIQRGRDHGLADYNTCRKAYGLCGVVGFHEITRNKWLQKQLKHVYGDVDHIDPWIGGLAEDHVEGGNVGEFFLAVLKDQFERLRDGDRFWYEIDNGLTSERKAEIANTRLADIIRRNTRISDIQDNVFIVEC